MKKLFPLLLLAFTTSCSAANVVMHLPSTAFTRTLLRATNAPNARDILGVGASVSTNQFNATQFSVGSASIDIISGARQTNIWAEGTISLKEAGTTRASIFPDSTGLLFTVGSENNLKLLGTSFANTNDVIIGGGDLSLGVGGAFGFSARTYTNVTKTIADADVMASMSGVHGNVIVTVQGSIGSWINPMFIIKKSDASANTVTISSSTGNFDYPAATTMVLSNQFQTATMVFDDDAGEYKLISMYDPIATAAVATRLAGRKTARLTTGSINAASSALITNTWATPFADANYVLTASVQDSTAAILSLRMVHLEAITATGVSVRVENSSAGALTGTLHLIAEHD